MLSMLRKTEYFSAIILIQNTTYYDDLRFVTNASVDIGIIKPLSEVRIIPCDIEEKISRRPIV